jgi:hypothetical protein
MIFNSNFAIEPFKPAPGYVLCLKSLPPDLYAREGLKWPEKGRVAAPDWDPTQKFGNGLHAFKWGAGEARLAHLEGYARWLVLSVREKDIVELDLEVKFPKCEVLYCGKREIAVYIIQHYAPTGTAVMFANITVGDGETAIGGDYAFLKGGDFSTVTGGYCATVIGGYGATVTGGGRANVTGGDHATVTGGDHATVTGGDHATVTGGYYATVTGGDCANVTGGYGATVTGGDFATVSGGKSSNVCGGIKSVLIIEHWDGVTFKKQVAIVDGKKILPGVRYCLNKAQEFVRAD